MGWNDFYRRRDVLNAVLERARRDPTGTLPMALAEDVFSGPADLLLALHHKWMLALTARLELAMAEAADPMDAWRAAAAEHHVLRRLIDANAERYAAELRPALEGEQRLLLALTQPGGPAPNPAGRRGSTHPQPLGARSA